VNWWVLFGALFGGILISIVSVAVSIRIAHKFDVLDYPDGERKTQHRPIPKLGGLAVAVAFTFVGLISLLFLSSPGETRLAAAALLPALFAGFVGFVDDRRHINPYLRIGLQAVVGVLIWALGSRVEVFQVGWLDAVLVVIFVIVLINGLNLLDNSDGLAASTVVVAGLGASVIAVLFQQELVSVLGFALVGVSLGFLWHNWFPARVYLGDSGAYFLATLLAVLIIRLRPETVSPLLGLVIALLLVALPLFDTVYVVTKRIRAGIHPFTAGRDHLSHGLQERGISVPGSVGVLQILSIVGVLAAVSIALLMGGTIR
jgi:UDP-GlcNAc:undecaprenyl-phosphate GlcNAc-1-phosphate transferase